MGFMTIPSLASVLQEVEEPLLPSSSTAHIRQEPIC